jgi:predicted ABC-type ATPase
VTRAHIVVIAGVNGSGKSSVAGEALQSCGVPFFNPDLHTKALMSENISLSLDEANAQAWNDGVTLLKLALNTGGNFAFETTLGGSTITDLLIAGAKDGAKIDMYYVGLASVELNIQRVASRVAKGGHDIPVTMIGKRFESSPKNLIRLMPFLAELKLYDNSDAADPEAGHAPQPRLLLHMRDRKIISRVGHSTSAMTSADWARHIISAANAANAISGV